MPFRFFAPLLVVALLVGACTADRPAPGEAPPAGVVAPVANEGSAGARNCTRLPVGTHLPRLNSHRDQLLLSYVRSGGAKDSLQSRFFTTAGWSRPLTAASGDDWFVNWADRPGIVAYRAPALEYAHFAWWLDYSGTGTYDYDIRFKDQANHRVRSAQTLHQDGVRAEHGFVSTAALPTRGLQVSWLDGRHTKEKGADAGATETGDAGHGHGGGAMTLRTKLLGAATSVELDDRVCDCCGTATVATADRTLVAYRDRSADEVRDISYVVKPTGGAWSAPRPVFKDGWRIEGCPVNGPALAANAGGDIVVVWYTEAAGRKQVKIARYDAATETFAEPRVLAEDGALGRVDVQLTAGGTALVSLLRATNDAGVAEVVLCTVPPSGTVETTVLATTPSARASGFPVLALHQDRLYHARTVVDQQQDQHYVEVCWRAAP